MKTLERLLVHHMRLQVAEDLDSLQFAYQKHIGVEDAILYMLHWAYAYLDVPGSYVRIMFFDFSCAFNTIRPLILKDKLLGMGVAPSLTFWIIDYLTARPQYVRMGRCVSGTLKCSTGAPQGTVLAPFLFTLYTSYFRYNSDSCHIQKYSDDMSVVACVSGGLEKEYRDLVECFNGWSKKNCLLLNTIKKLMVDFRRSKTPCQSVCIDGGEIETVQTCKYLVLDDNLKWSANTEAKIQKL